MTKQLLYMIVWTAVGSLGAAFWGPFIAILAYYHFSILRPQFLWEWALPAAQTWSYYVALPAIAGAVAYSAGMGGGRSLPWTRTHWLLMAFFGWVMLSYTTAVYEQLAYPWLIENAKICCMLVVGSILVNSLNRVWVMYVMAAATLGYIGYEVNFLYFQHGYPTIWYRGYGGYDNNGAGLMLAMGIPLCFFMWEALESKWRWLYLALVFVLLHGVLLSFSRGAMLSILVMTPFIIYRSRRRVLIAGCVGAFFLFGLPLIMGKEVEKRFFSISEHDADASAQSRFSTWRAAWLIANDYPILGAGIRNSSALVGRYGNKNAYQTIHSQYLQVAADSGFPALALYLAVVWGSLGCLRRARREFRSNDAPTKRRYLSMVSGIECTILTFCIGAVFLSLETFELTYILFLLSMQLRALTSLPAEAEPEPEEGNAAS